MEGSGHGNSYGGRYAGGDFDLVEFIKRPQTICRFLCILFAIIVFGCISAACHYGPSNVCIFNSNQDACQYGTAIGVLAFLECLLFLVIDAQFDHISSAEWRRYIVVFEVIFSGAWTFLWFVGFCFLTDEWRKSSIFPANESNHARAVITFSFFSIFTWLFAIVVFGCISSAGYDKSYHHCIFNKNQDACNYGITIGVLAFVICVLFIAVDSQFNNLSNASARKYAVTGDLFFSCLWSFLWFVGFCFLTDQWRKSTDNVTQNQTNHARAAIAFSFFSIFTWIALSLMSHRRYKQGDGFETPSSTTYQPGFSNSSSQHENKRYDSFPHPSSEDDASVSYQQQQPFGAPSQPFGVPPQQSFGSSQQPFGVPSQQPFGVPP